TQAGQFQWREEHLVPGLRVLDQQARTVTGLVQPDVHDRELVGETRQFSPLHAPVRWCFVGHRPHSFVRDRQTTGRDGMLASAAPPLFISYASVRNNAPISL